MTVRELTNELYEVGYSDDVVIFAVKGQKVQCVDLEGQHGRHDIPVDIDGEAVVDGIHRIHDKKTVVVELDL